jgi:hypothetical protein
VAVRICPHCTTEITAANVAAYSSSIECPGCKARLEVAPGMRDYIAIPRRAYRAPGAAAISLRLCSNSAAVSGLCPTACAILTLPFGSFPSYSML